MGKLKRTEIWVLKKNLYNQIHSSIIYDSPKREMLQVSIDRWLYNFISWTQANKQDKYYAILVKWIQIHRIQK